MTLLQQLNAIVANYEALESSLAGPADSDDMVALDLRCHSELCMAIAAANKQIAQCANVVSHAELGLPDEPTAAKVLGVDSQGNPIHRGDIVNHTEKSLVNGIVVGPGQPHKGELTVVVSYEGRPKHVNRLSKLVKA